MKTVKRAGVAAAVLAGIGILAGVYVLTKDVVIPRDDKGKLDFGKIEARDRDKDQLFTFLGRDIERIDVTIREVDYGPLTTADDSPSETPADAEAEAAEDPAKTDDEPLGTAEQEPDVPERKLGLARVGKIWNLTAPVHARADQGLADGFANAFAELRVKGREADVDPLNPKYGLNNPCVIVDVVRRGGRTKLLIGRDAPVGSDIYLMVEGEQALYYASSSVKTSFVKDAKELRDKKVAAFETDDVEALVLEASGHRVVCEQTGKKDAREWWMTQPTEARADNFAVDDILRAVKDLEAKEFVDGVKSLSAYGLDKPTVVARLDFGKDTDDVVVKLGRRVTRTPEASSSSTSTDTGPKEMVYCLAEGRDEVFLVDAEVEGKLNKKPIDLRDATVVDFETAKVTKVAIDRQTGTDLELVKADGKWSFQKPQFAPADFSKVDNLLWDLKDIKAVDFLDDKPVNANVSGLSNPAIVVRLTLEGDASPLEIRLGKKDTGGMRYYCQVTGLSGPVLVLDSVLEKIPDSVDKLKEEQTDTTPMSPMPDVKESP
ncbi:MAG: DUF4340 domain-containing protein [Armatimonadetes bacterium]|nr:DUF4340 domain-containing protein [Armatimonadota bacterium]